MMKTLTFLCVILSCSCANGLDLDANVNSHNKVVVCYVAGWSAYSPANGEFVVKSIDPILCTHIIYAFAGLNSTQRSIYSLDSYLDTEEGYGKAQYKKVVSFKQQQPKLKVSIAIGGWNEGSGKYSDMAETPENRKAFIDSVLSFIKKHGFDGLDMNWMHPGIRNRSRVQDRENFVLLLKEMRTEFDKFGFLLTAAISPKPDEIIRAYDVPAITQHLHFIHISAYNYHAPRDNQSELGHNAPLRMHNSSGIELELRLSVEDTLKYLLKYGASPEKLVLGVPFFGHAFTVADKNLHEIGSKSNGSGFQGPYTRQDGFLGYNEICKDLNKTEEGVGKWIEQWDDVAEVPYMYKGEKWVSYDNEKSISIKARYAFNQGLAGLMIWSLDTDDFLPECSNVRYPLLRAINSEFKAAYIDKQAQMNIKREGETSDPVEGSNVTLICNIRGSNFPYPPKWFYQNSTGNYHLLTFTNKSLDGITEATLKISEQPNKEIQIETKGSYVISQDLYVYNSSLYLKNVTLDTPYTKFKCEINDTFKEISFAVKEINNDPVSNAIVLDKGVVQNLTCNRLSHISVQWLKDGKRYTGTVYDNKTASVLLLDGKANELGTYHCRWNNSRGEAKERNFTVSLSFVDNTNVIIIFATVIGLFLVGIGIGIKFYLDKKKEFENMLNGDPSKIDPDVPMEYQTEYLPYDKKWEFPKKRLRLGQELGSGCFGRVVRAEAVGLKDADESVKTVAVKMIKPTAKSKDAIVALIRELKILIYLGDHLNVVNLLGACTKTNVMEEILVIIDFCEFGNLKSYLIKHRSEFINQLNELGDMQTHNETEEIDAATTNGEGVNDLTVLHPLSGANKLSNSTYSVTENQPDNMPDPKPIGNFVKISDANLNENIKTSDLISWSLQIARGMEFLASKKVLHGDLAARNVLLADHGIVKVADFGMARQMKDYDYKKSGDELLPIKWMAIESLTDHIFSSQSDVWSYGIVLWELFSLGKVPYAGMENGWVLLREILCGKRLEKPKYAPNFLGEMMTNCWQKEPSDRPTFSQLADVIEKQIESVVGFNYLNFNEADNENGLIREIVDPTIPTPTNSLEIVKMLNETTTLQSPTEGIENLSFFGDSH